MNIDEHLGLTADDAQEAVKLDLQTALPSSVLLTGGHEGETAKRIAQLLFQRGITQVPVPPNAFVDDVYLVLRSTERIPAPPDGLAEAIDRELDAIVAFELLFEACRRLLPTRRDGRFLAKELLGAERNTLEKVLPALSVAQNLEPMVVGQLLLQARQRTSSQGIRLVRSHKRGAQGYLWKVVANQATYKHSLSQ